MKTNISETSDFLRAVEIAPIAAQPGTWHVQFSSQLRTANNPQEWQRNFALILGEDGVRALRDALDAKLNLPSFEVVK